MKKNSILFFLIVFLPAIIFSQSLEPLLSPEEMLIAVINGELTISVDQFSELQESMIKSYLDEQNGKAPFLLDSIRQREQNDLKGGLMVFSGVVSIAVGGLSFYLSELYYDKYSNAEVTADAISYRRATNSLDFFKFFLVSAGGAISLGSAHYFSSGPDRTQLKISLQTEKSWKGAFLVR